MIFANAGIPMNFGRANQPAYVLTYFGPLLTYIILLIGGVVLVQKRKKKSEDVKEKILIQKGLIKRQKDQTKKEVPSF